MDLAKMKKKKRTGGFRRKVIKYYKEMCGEEFKIQRHNQSSSSQTHTTCQDVKGSVEVMDESENEECIRKYDSEEDENDITDDDEKNGNFRDDLKKWANNHNISHAALKDLFCVLNKTLNCNLPLDPRTLMKTSQKIQTTPLDNGEYWHHGITEPLESRLNCFTSLPDSVSLNVNIDGLPIHKSSKHELWPILCNIYEKPKIRPFVVGIYSGVGKPHNLDIFLGQFVNEMKILLANGIDVIRENQTKKVEVKLRCFICDSPARALIKGVCNFNGKHGCLKCCIIGEYSHTSHTVVFPRTDCPERNDEDFRAKKYGLHHKYDSPLLQLPIDMIKDILVGDSLHLIDLGIVKRLLTGWRDGNFGKYVTKWCAKDITAVTSFLQKCKLPSEIHRSVRGLDVLAYWKASEYRTFLYYLSIIIVKDVICHDAYVHFLTLFCAITICSSEEHFKFLPLAEQLLQHFVEHYRDFYGEDYMTSNVHNLTHLIAEVQQFGKLQDFNAYPFENKLYLIKNLLRHGHRPLAQIAKRLSEQTDTILEANHIFPFVKKHQSRDGPILKLHLENFILCSQKTNKWFLNTKLEVVEVKFISNDENEIRIRGNCIKDLTCVFETPVKSSYFNIWKCRDDVPKYEAIYNITDVKCKLVAIDYKGEIIFIPLLHTY